MYKIDSESIKLETPAEGLEDLQANFLKDRLLEVEKVEEALAGKDFKYVCSTAHNWKGFSEPYGFNLLGDIAKDLEIAAKSEDLPKCLDIYNDIKEYLDIKRNFLQDS